MNKRVMVVEDEQVFHIIYDELLEGTGYEIIHTYDGEDALSRLEEVKPDLIILDIILDMMTGDTFFLYLKGMPEYANIPVIIVSSSSPNNYKGLKDLDPDLVYLDKSRLGERLIPEIKAKIR